MAARNFTGRPTNVLIEEKRATTDGVEYGYRLYRNTAAKKVSYILKRKPTTTTSTFWTTVGTWEDRFVAYIHFILLTSDSTSIEKALGAYNYEKVIPVPEDTATSEEAE